MASLEGSERVAGATLLSVPAFDFFVWALDNYARLELAVKLHEALPPLIVSPTTGFVCMCLGLGLLYLSQKAHSARVIESAQMRRVLDSSGRQLRTKLRSHGRGRYWSRFRLSY